MLGTVSAVPNFGAGDILEVLPANGGRTGDAVPFTAAPSCRRGPARRRRIVAEPPVYRRGRARASCRNDGPAAGGAANEDRAMSFAADVVTLFPDLFPGPLGASVTGAR